MAGCYRVAWLVGQLAVDWLAMPDTAGYEHLPAGLTDGARLAPRMGPSQAGARPANGREERKPGTASVKVTCAASPRSSSPEQGSYNMSIYGITVPLPGIHLMGIAIVDCDCG